MGWWLPSLICKRYKLCNHMVGRGQTSRQRVVLFCFVSFPVLTGALASAKPWLAFPGAGCPCAGYQLLVAHATKPASPRIVLQPPGSSKAALRRNKCFARSAAWEPCSGFAVSSQPQHTLPALSVGHLRRLSGAPCAAQVRPFGNTRRELTASSGGWCAREASCQSPGSSLRAGCSLSAYHHSSCNRACADQMFRPCGGGGGRARWCSSRASTTAVPPRLGTAATAPAAARPHTCV